MSVFDYKYERDFNPIPPAEASLPTVTAERFVKVSDKRPFHLEGVVFDRTGSTMYFNATDIGRVFRMDMATKKVEEIWTDPTVRSFGVKLHRVGRIFVGCFPTGKPDSRDGGIIILSPEGKELAYMCEGVHVDDFAFDKSGGFYFTHFVGDLYNRIGAVYHMDADMKTVTTFADKLAAPNGISLSPDEKVLWITEYNGGRLLRVPTGGGWSSTPYAFTGYHGPDSCETDGDGNLYVALTFQGRILIFNRDGFPIGQVLMPDRDKGRNLIGTHATVRPGTRELYISCSDDETDEGSWIMKAEAFAEPNMNAFPFT